MLGCVNKRNREQGELRSITVRSKVDTSLELILLKSFGISSDVQIKDFVIGASNGSGEVNGLEQRVPGLAIVLKDHPEPLVQKILSNYGTSVTSRVKFQSTGVPFELSDLMSPAVQALVNRQVAIEGSSQKTTSADALISVLLADVNQFLLKSHDPQNTANLFLDGISFRNVAEVPAASKSVSANRRERNSGFAVGDILVFADKDAPSAVTHAVLWIDHDVYFEALSLGSTIFFRMASYAQVMQELSARTQMDVKQLQMTVVRRHVSWSDVALRVQQFRDTRTIGSAVFNFDARGRGTLASTDGFKVRAVDVRYSDTDNEKGSR